MYRDLWPKEIPDAVRRIAWSVARRWARSCPTIADDIFNESRLACWLACRHYQSGNLPLTAYVRQHVEWACRRTIGESRYYRFTDHRYRKRRLELYEKYHEIAEAISDESDQPWLPQVWSVLTDRQARVLQLRAVNGLSYGDIAHITGSSKASVAECYRVAIRKARAIMESKSGR